MARALPLPFAAVIAAACAGPDRYYEGPRLPPEEVAVVRIESGIAASGERFDVALRRFDGLPLRRSRPEIEVLPGSHSFDVSWSVYRLAPDTRRTWVAGESGTMEMTFELRPGFRYVLFWVGGDQPLRFRELPLP